MLLPFVLGKNAWIGCVGIPARTRLALLSLSFLGVIMPEYVWRHGSACRLERQGI